MATRLAFRLVIFARRISAHGAGRTLRRHHGGIMAGIMMPAMVPVGRD
jgi:hypothetical protein